MRTRRTIGEYMADLRKAIDKEFVKNRTLREQRAQDFDPALVDEIEASDAQLAKLQRRLEDLQAQQALEASEEFKRAQIATVHQSRAKVAQCFAADAGDLAKLQEALLAADAIIARIAGRRADAVDALRNAIAVCVGRERVEQYYPMPASKVRGSIENIREAVADANRIRDLDAKRTVETVLQNLDALISRKQAQINGTLPQAPEATVRDRFIGGPKLGREVERRDGFVEVRDAGSLE